MKHFIFLVFISISTISFAQLTMYDIENMNKKEMKDSLKNRLVISDALKTKLANANHQLNNTKESLTQTENDLKKAQAELAECRGISDSLSSTVFAYRDTLNDMDGSGRMDPKNFLNNALVKNASLENKKMRLKLKELVIENEVEVNESTGSLSTNNNLNNHYLPKKIENDEIHFFVIPSEEFETPLRMEGEDFYQKVKEMNMSEFNKLLPVFDFSGGKFLTIKCAGKTMSLTYEFIKSTDVFTEPVYLLKLEGSDLNQIGIGEEKWKDEESTTLYLPINNFENNYYLTLHLDVLKMFGISSGETGMVLNTSTENGGYERHKIHYPVKSEEDKAYAQKVDGVHYHYISNVGFPAHGKKVFVQNRDDHRLDYVLMLLALEVED